MKEHVLGLFDDPNTAHKPQIKRRPVVNEQPPVGTKTSEPVIHPEIQRMLDATPLRMFIKTGLWREVKEIQNLCVKASEIFLEDFEMASFADKVIEEMKKRPNLHVTQAIKSLINGIN